ncbi:hypothetical protein C8R46DRAFT_863709, partial [Mycena filopes]
LVFPPEATQWLRDALRVLARRDLGIHFRVLMETLIRLETRFGFDRVPRNGVLKHLRPEEVTTWIASARGARSPRAYGAGVRSIGGYALRWMAWWDSLQPAWRGREANGRWMQDEVQPGMDWGSLSSPGPNGCLSLVAALYFWGSACEDLPGTMVEKADWEMAVHDVTWVLE